MNYWLIGVLAWAILDALLIGLVAGAKCSSDRTNN
jgi:hypothetical protein